VNTFKSVSGPWSPVILKALDDGLIRPFLGRLPPLTPSEPPDEVKRILVIRPGGLGDAILLLPALIALQEAYPQAALVVLAEARNVQAFSLLPFSCRVMDYTCPVRFLSLLTGPPFDLVIDTEQWYGLSALVARMVRGRFRLGFGTNPRARCFHGAVDYSHHEYEVEAFFRLLEPLGIEPPDWWEMVHFRFREGHPYSDPSLSGGREVRGSGRSGLLAALFPGASHPSRRWGRERFLEVAQFLVGKGWKVVVVGGPEEVDDGAFISSRLSSDKVFDCTGSTSLVETAGVLSSCRFMVTADSGIMHLAWLLGVPTLSLFGPGIVEKWAPRGPQHLAVRLDLSCSPCTRFGMVSPCPHDYACMRELTSQMVMGALEEFLPRLRTGGL